MSMRPLDPDEQALLDKAKARMTSQLNAIHERGRLTNFFANMAVPELVTTAAYCIGNVDAATDEMGEGHIKGLITVAGNALKDLHFALSIGGDESEHRTKSGLVDSGGSPMPGDPPH